MAHKLLEMTDIVKRYYTGGEEQTVLKHVNFTVEKGEFVSILGPSGSGKSTMMNIIGCLDVPNSGNYILNGKETSELNQVELARIRNKEIGFIFQSFQLLKRSTILENVELPLIYSKVPERERKRRATELLDRMGLGNKLEFFPNQLSGGQQQRVAISRAIVTQPSILLADEPTGALDQKTGKQVMKLFQELNNEGRTIIMITHDKHIATYSNRVVKILDGVLSEGGEEDA
ncbi:MAG: ABC transporter ATP-binding protein [Clostridiales bacterium]|nr:ABC transporter ATP-binding protein [Clostridiales bacterium]